MFSIIAIGQVLKDAKKTGKDKWKGEKGKAKEPRGVVWLALGVVGMCGERDEGGDRYADGQH